MQKKDIKQLLKKETALLMKRRDYWKIIDDTQRKIDKLDERIDEIMLKIDLARYDFKDKNGNLKTKEWEEIWKEFFDTDEDDSEKLSEEETYDIDCITEDDI